MDNPCKKETIVKIRKGKTSVYIPRFDSNTQLWRQYSIRLQNGVMILTAIGENYRGNRGKLARVIPTGKNGFVGLRIPRNISERAGFYNQKRVFYLSQADSIHIFNSYRQMLLYEICDYYGYIVLFGDTVTLNGTKRIVYNSVEAALCDWLPELEVSNGTNEDEAIWAKYEIDCIKAIASETSPVPLAV